MNEENCLCDSCGEEFPASQIINVTGRALCPSCLEEETLVCSRCGERIRPTENAGEEDYPLCERCFTGHYLQCSGCGLLIRTEEAHYLGSDEYEERPYCSFCYEQASRRNWVRDYFYKPDPVFYGDGPRFFGVELEIDDGGENSDNAYEIQCIGNQEAGTPPPYPY